jgi:hypothetical protein
MKLDDWIGAIIDERYRIEAIIGVGGMAAVFSAEHVRLGHRVALKVLLPAFQEHEEIRARFAREALAMARLDHPHIATAIDYGELDDGGRYMVMPAGPGREPARRAAPPWGLPLGRGVRHWRAGGRRPRRRARGRGGAPRSQARQRHGARAAWTGPSAPRCWTSASRACAAWTPPTRTA